MKDLQLKEELTLDGPGSTEPRYPSFYVCDEQMPEIANWEPGSEHEVTFKIKVKQRTQENTVDGTDTDSTMQLIAYTPPK